MALASHLGETVIVDQYLPHIHELLQRNTSIATMKAQHDAAILTVLSLVDGLVDILEPAVALQCFVVKSSQLLVLLLNPSPSVERFGAIANTLVRLGMRLGRKRTRVYLLPFVHQFFETYQDYFHADGSKVELRAGSRSSTYREIYSAEVAAMLYPTFAAIVGWDIMRSDIGCSELIETVLASHHDSREHLFDSGSLIFSRSASPPPPPLPPLPANTSLITTTPGARQEQQQSQTQSPFRPVPTTAAKPTPLPSTPPLSSSSSSSSLTSITSTATPTPPPTVISTPASSSRTTPTLASTTASAKLSNTQSVLFKIGIGLKGTASDTTNRTVPELFRHDDEHNEREPRKESTISAISKRLSGTLAASASNVPTGSSSSNSSSMAGVKTAKPSSSASVVSDMSTTDSIDEHTAAQQRKASWIHKLIKNEQHSNGDRDVNAFRHKSIYYVRAHTLAITALACHATEQWIATASKDATVRVWSLEEPDTNATPEPAPTPFNFGATASHQNCLFTYSFHKNPITDIVYNPYTEMMASTDGSVHVCAHHWQWVAEHSARRGLT
jgi:hypothetical protein